MKNYLAQMNLQPTASSNGSIMGSTMKNRKNSFDQILKNNLDNNQSMGKKETTPSKYTAMIHNKKDQLLRGNSLKQQPSTNLDVEEAAKAFDKVDDKAGSILAMLFNFTELLQTNLGESVEQSADGSAVEAIIISIEEILKSPVVAEGSLEKVEKELNQQLSMLLKEMHVDMNQRDLKFTHDEQIAINMDANDILTELQHIIDKFANGFKEHQEEALPTDMVPIVQKEMDNQPAQKAKMESLEDIEESILPINEKAVTSPKEATETKKDEKVKVEQPDARQLEDINSIKPVPQQNGLNMIPGSAIEKAEINFSDPVSATQSAPIKPTFLNIMEQVLPKAEVFVDGEHSEMLIQLKPDNLGKLVMKLEVEKGIVVAKFLAESHIVKEILESNMNTLKDSLQQKGLNVQELSVYVGNDGNFQGHQQFMAFQKRQNNSRIKGLGLTHGLPVIQAEARTVKSLHSENIDFLA